MVEFNLGAKPSRRHGQAMVEYALILVLLALAFGVAIAATGPAIGNVFCNVVHNIGGSTADPQGGNCGAVPTDLANDGGNPPLFWMTVTWIAQNPQGETPFPTSIHRPPTSVSGGLHTNTPTATPTNTPTNTPTPTPTNTGTATYTPTAGPSPTDSDIGFSVPFDDQINNQNWWRLDTGDFTTYGVNWNAQWYTFAKTGGTSCSNYTYSFTNKSLTTISNLNGINFNWGAGNPFTTSNPTGTGLSNANTDKFGASFTRTTTVEQTAYYSFALTSNSVNDWVKLTIDGTVALNLTCGGSQTVTQQLTAGSHTIQVDYGNYTGNAAVSLSVSRQNSNASDVVSGNNSCTWGRSSGTNNPVSPLYMFEDNPGQTTWPNNQICYLELRGYINLTAADTHPILSYWDIWDFAASSNVTAQLQVGTYASGGSTNWTTVSSLSAGTRNYAWTRSQVDLSTYAASLGSQIAVRFVIGSTNASSPFRWYIDDVEVVDDTAPTTTYTVGKTWNLDDRTQMSDFIYDGDSYDVASPSGASGSRRWDLTSTHAHSGTAWDDSPVGTSDPTGVYQDINAISPPTGAGNARVHYLEIKYPIDLRTGVAPLQDQNGNTGVPLLTFWQAFDIQPNTSIRVQYTRDPGDPSENLSSTTETWTDIPNQGVLIDYNVPAGASRTNLTMTPVQIDLTNIPNWQTSPFRLRFALYVDNVASSFGDGWYIDDIAIARDSASPYFAYPFTDDAENLNFFKATWDAIGGEWGQTTEKGGLFNSPTAYSDSPLAQYDANTVQMLQMHYAIDLLHDTPADTNNPADVPANNPMLSFWMQRSVGSDEVLSVDLWTPEHTTWTSIWSYNSASDSSFRTQNAWERVEINLETALTQVTGESWAQISQNLDGITDDDDVKIRFNFSSGSSVGYDGVYVDQIQLQDSPAYSHLLWPTSRGGSGNYVDSVEYASPAYSYDSGIGSRWYMGGNWGTTGAAGYEHSGSLSLTDSPAGNYGSNTFSVLELYPKIDLTSTLTSDLPTMYFWTRYQVGSDDNIQVQISTQSSASTTQSYDKIGGWTAWASQPMMIGDSVTDAGSSTLNNTEIDTWEQGQVNLSSFVGKVIRVRFVVSVPNTTFQADGIYVDDVAFTVGRSQIALPFTDNAQTTANWITEGVWGLGTNYFIGTGTSSADLGPNPWVGTYFDCEPLKLSSESCGSSTTESNILGRNANYPITHTPQNDVSNESMVGPEIIPDINFNWGSSNTPLNNAAPANYSPPTGAGYADTFSARWTRQVQLAPGTYSFSTVSDDGVRMWIDDYTGTDLSNTTTVTEGTANSRYIINDWTDHSARLTYATFTVTSAVPITRTLTLEYYENGGSAVMILNATSSSFSFTDSPNTLNPDGTTFTTVYSVYPGDSSLMLNGFFDLSDTTKIPVLTYQRLYDVAANSHFYVEVSTDGGFTWSKLSGETINGLSTRLLPSNNWDTRSINLNLFEQPNVMIRFRLDTRANSAASPTADGVYITAIHVSEN